MWSHIYAPFPHNLLVCPQGWQSVEEGVICCPMHYHFASSAEHQLHSLGQLKRNLSLTGNTACTSVIVLSRFSKTKEKGYSKGLKSAAFKAVVLHTLLHLYHASILWAPTLYRWVHSISSCNKSLLCLHLLTYPENSVSKTEVCEPAYCVPSISTALTYEQFGLWLEC